MRETKDVTSTTRYIYIYQGQAAKPLNVSTTTTDSWRGPPIFCSFIYTFRLVCLIPVVDHDTSVRPSPSLKVKYSDIVGLPFLASVFFSRCSSFVCVAQSSTRGCPAPAISPRVQRFTAIMTPPLLRPVRHHQLTSIDFNFNTEAQMKTGQKRITLTRCAHKQLQEAEKESGDKATAPAVISQWNDWRWTPC